MSAKRGSDTLQLSVADGRALLTGLLSGFAPPAPPEYDPETGRRVRRRDAAEPLVDLQIPLPRALAVLTAARAAGPAGRDGFHSSSGFQQKPLRPVLVGASGPFARAAREAGKGGSVSGSVASGSLGGGSSRGSSRGGGGSSRGSSSRRCVWNVGVVGVGAFGCGCRDARCLGGPVVSGCLGRGGAEGGDAGAVVAGCEGEGEGAHVRGL